MEFDWLESKQASRRLQGSDWDRAMTDKAALLARLNYSKAYALKRCEQNLIWTFGERKAWPVSAAKLKKLVGNAFRSN